MRKDQAPSPRTKPATQHSVTHARQPRESLSPPHTHAHAITLPLLVLAKSTAAHHSARPLFICVKHKVSSSFALPRRHIADTAAIRRRSEGGKHTRERVRACHAQGGETGAAHVSRGRGIRGRGRFSAHILEVRSIDDVVLPGKI